MGICKTITVILIINVLLLSPQNKVIFYQIKIRIKSYYKLGVFNEWLCKKLVNRMKYLCAPKN